MIAVYTSTHSFQPISWQMDKTSFNFAVYYNIWVIQKTKPSNESQLKFQILSVLKFQIFSIDFRADE